jgi:hypothetical protein
MGSTYISGRLIARRADVSRALLLDPLREPAERERDDCHGPFYGFMGGAPRRATTVLCHRAKRDLNVFGRRQSTVLLLVVDRELRGALGAPGVPISSHRAGPDRSSRD